MSPEHLALDVAACPSDEQLHALAEGDLPDGARDRVAAHVRQCSRCEEALRTLAERDTQLVGALRSLAGERADLFTDRSFQTAAASTGGQDDAGAAEVLPRDLRDYRLLERLGRGGMGTVYRAVHTRLGRTVALKVLARGRTSDAEAVARFEREMIGIGKLDHPNIVRATDAGIADGTHYLVMEYVEGMDLARLVKRRGRLSVADACALTRCSAEDLQHAHDHGLIHRDVKPSNLILTPAGRVAILDLGLALLVRDKAPGGMSTGSGFVLGTYDYLAPEQGEHPESVDARADVYSLGCTLYHLLAGHPPFPPPDYVTPLQKALAHIRTPIPPLEGLPARLTQALGKMLAKDSAARFASAADVADALEEFPAGADLPALFAPAATGDLPRTQVPARRSGFRIRPAPTGPRHTRWWALATGLAVAAALAISGLLWISNDAGTLEIVTDDPAVKVIVEKAGNEITVIDPATKRQVKLSAGKYGLRLSEDGKDLTMDKDAFTLTRGQKTVVTIRRILPPAVPVVGGSNRPPLAAVWIKAIAALPPERQVEEVVRELQRLNPGFDGSVVPALGEDGVTELSFLTDKVDDLRPLGALRHLTKLVCRGSAPEAGRLKDLTPLQGLPLTSLDCSYNPIGNLKPLQGMRLKELHCGWTRVAKLQPLAGMPLEYLDVSATPVADLGPLEKLPLQKLVMGGTKVKDLSPLRRVRSLTALNCYKSEVADLGPLQGLQLTYLNCNNTQVVDLAPVKGMPLESLLCAGCRIADLAPLKGMTTLKQILCFQTRITSLGPLQGLRLEHLDVGNTAVADLGPLRAMPLQLLACRNTPTKDFTPLRDMPIRYLFAHVTPQSDAEIVRSLKSVEQVNGMLVEEFLKQAEAKGP